MSGANYQRMWAYKPDGSACVFAIYPGDELPPGWSSDINVIVNPAHRDGQRLSDLARLSLANPVRVDLRPVPTQEVVMESADVEALETQLRYDEDNQLVIPPPSRKTKIRVG